MVLFTLHCAIFKIVFKGFIVFLQDADDHMDLFRQHDDRGKRIVTDEQLHNRSEKITFFNSRIPVNCIQFEMRLFGYPHLPLGLPFKATSSYCSRV